MYMIFRCEKCNYQTKHKSHFGKHINKLNPCSNEIIIHNKQSWENLKPKVELKSVEELNQLSKEQLVEIIKNLI